MQDLKVVLVQADQKWEDKLSNLTHFEGLLSEIEDADLIVLPEMFHTGFSMNTVELAEETSNSIGIDWLQKIAKQKQSAIYTSLIIKENGSYFNRGIFVYPDEELKFYNKIKLFGLAGEDNYYSPGKERVIVEYKGWKIQLQICYDLRFPEISRNFIDVSNQLPAYDVLVYIANWPEKRKSHWQTLLRARAIENQSYVIGVNRVGIDGKGLNYSGNSNVIDALGNESFNLDNQESISIILLKKEDLKEVRLNLPFLKD